MDFEPGFTPDDASLRFHFMQQAYECGEEALKAWRDPFEDFSREVFDRANVENDPRVKQRMASFSEKRREESEKVEIANMLNLHRISYFLMAFSLCEASVTKFADRLLHSVGSPFRVQDITGSGLERVKTVSRALGAEPNPVEGERWKDVLAFKDLRNALVHRVGFLEGDSAISKLQKKVERWNGVRLVDHGSPEFKSIEMDDFFVRAAIGELRAFTEEVASSFFKDGGSPC